MRRTYGCGSTSIRPHDHRIQRCDERDIRGTYKTSSSSEVQAPVFTNLCLDCSHSFLLSTRPFIIPTLPTFVPRHHTMHIQSCLLAGASLMLAASAAPSKPSACHAKPVTAVVPVDDGYDGTDSYERPSYSEPAYEWDSKPSTSKNADYPYKPALSSAASPRAKQAMATVAMTTSTTLLQAHRSSCRMFLCQLLPSLQYLRVLQATNMAATAMAMAKMSSPPEEDRSHLSQQEWLRPLATSPRASANLSEHQALRTMSSRPPPADL